jgi:CBS domain-containing protein
MTQNPGPDPTIPADGRDAVPLVEDVMIETDEVLHPDHPVGEAATRMRAAHLSMLPVADGDEIVGIYRLEDLAHRKEQPSNPPAAEDARVSRVADHVTADIPFCFAHDTVATAREALRRTGHAWLLVVNAADEYVGLISADVIAATAEGAPEASQAARRVRATGRAKGDAAGVPGVYSVRPKIRR